jgi:tRNA-dihydrouridine synthase
MYVYPSDSASAANFDIPTPFEDSIRNKNEQLRLRRNKELFSVAPMMGHTNRHYRHYFRLFSRNTFLYTEMIPSSQIVRAYRRARGIYLNVGTDKRVVVGRGGGIGIGDNEEINAEEIMEVVTKMKANPSREYQLYGHDREDNLTLHQLIGTSTGPAEHPVVLQLGGNDPGTLGMAAAIGAAYGNKDRGEYCEINLNCGCPSNAVGGRSGGCSLMKQPELVARCVEKMNSGVQIIAGASSNRRPMTGITVKHRLGVRDASTFDATADRSKNDDEAYEECSSFVRTVSSNADVTKFHVHARLGLLGEFTDEDDNEDRDDDESYINKRRKSRQSLWVPGGSCDNNTELPVAQSMGKIDHKREQERAKRRARKATVKNRDVPPLRPGVVNRLATEFSQFEFVSNGGIQTLVDVENIVDRGLYGNKETGVVVGAMVGRAAINHPCSFAGADKLWDGQWAFSARPTRGEMLQDYCRYCDDEEERIRICGSSSSAIESLRRRLVAVPFHLFVGEEGSDEFQRRLKKLREKCRSIKASSVISGAASFIPSETLNKCVDDFIPWEDITKYEGGLKRGSAMQRIVY